MPASSPSPARAAALKIVRTLRRAGHVAYFAGGCVRDELLGLVPSDYDVATDAVPERVVKLFPGAGEVGKSFGVVIVRLAREVVEVATFRSDGTYSDARRPDSVRFSSPEEDAARRDFTINALFLDPATEAGAGTGEDRVIDFVGGRADLAAKVLRAVGDPAKRLAEDHLRALRGARFAARLGFAIDPRTAEAIREQGAALRGVSRERIGDEVRRMLEHPTRAAAAMLLDALSLRQPVLSADMSAAVDPVSLRALPAEVRYPAALAAWALDLGFAPQGAATHDSIEKLVQEWRLALDLSNDTRDGMRAALVLGCTVVQAWSGLGVAARKRAASSPGFGDALSAFRGRFLDPIEEAERDVENLSGDGVGLRPLPLVTGADLIAMGLKPGPAFKVVLDKVYDAQLERKVENSQQALELARSLSV